MVVLVMLICTEGAIAQQYPQGYFRNPLRIPILLAGNFGECRPGHFHSGLDIRTGGHEGEPVYAAADGYVSRIKMEPGGFGHGLYITHPNGYTTLYAHLNDFVPRIQQYARAQQYAQESWTVDLRFSPGQFPVKKGEQIAWSGNTGGSTAPHLHFEIRDSKTEHPLNGQLFGLDIKDTRPPVPQQLAVYGKAVAVVLGRLRSGRCLPYAAGILLEFDGLSVAFDARGHLLCVGRVEPQRHRAVRMHLRRDNGSGGRRCGRNAGSGRSGGPGRGCGSRRLGEGAWQGNCGDEQSSKGSHGCQV